MLSNWGNSTGKIWDATAFDFVTMKRGGRLSQSQPSPAVLQIISNVVTWCSCKPFRSPELDPSAILDVPDWSHGSEPIEAWIERKNDSYIRAISWINETRSKLLRTVNVETVKPLDALSNGKLLAYEQLETVDDGASEAASKGFFNLQDAPPWDTWFLYGDRVVFCCVPEFAILTAQNGIDANPVDCIHWIDWSQLPRIGDITD